MYASQLQTYLKKFEGSFPSIGMSLPFHSVLYVVCGVLCRICGVCLGLWLLRLSEPSRGGRAGDGSPAICNLSVEERKLPTGLGGNRGG